MAEPLKPRPKRKPARRSDQVLAILDDEMLAYLMKHDPDWIRNRLALSLARAQRALRRQKHREQRLTPLRDRARGWRRREAARNAAAASGLHRPCRSGQNARNGGPT